VAWDAYIDVCGNRYSVPSALMGQTVEVRIGLDGQLRVYDPTDPTPDKPPVATHTLREAHKGWVTVSEHHAPLWEQTLHVEQRSLQIYEAVL
jgi:hypothetical protein